MAKSKKGNEDMMTTDNPAALDPLGKYDKQAVMQAINDSDPFETLKEQEIQIRAEALEVYRAGCNEVARTGRLSPKTARKLAEAMQTLNLRAYHFQMDCKAIISVKDREEDAANASSTSNYWSEKAEAAGKRHRELTEELARVLAEQRHAAVMATVGPSIRGQVERIKSDHPRIFAPHDAAFQRLYHEPLNRDHLL